MIVGFIGMELYLAGIIGISNIMVYIVKEKNSRNWGKKSQSAPNREALSSLIIQESIVITVNFWINRRCLRRFDFEINWQ